MDWGDGTVIWCATMTSKTRYTDPLLMSPDCGHKYEHPGDYTITVTQQWIVDWAALNQHGQLQLQSAGTYPNLPIRLNIDKDFALNCNLRWLNLVLKLCERCR